MSEFIFNLKLRISSVKHWLSSLNSKLVKSAVIVFVIGLSIPLTVFLTFNKTHIEQNAALNNERVVNGYIVEFKDAPLSEKITVKSLQLDIEKEKEKINLDKENSKKDILRILGKKSFNYYKTTPTSIKIKSEYSVVINAVALDISKDDAEKLKKSSYVKNVYPDLKVSTNLTDSVPGIGADKVWISVKDAQGNYITGKGVNIAIIDTGVDPSHETLGKSTLVERPFKKVNKWSLDGSLSLYTNDLIYYSKEQNKLVYPSITDKGFSISIYDFYKNETLDVELGNLDLSTNLLNNSRFRPIIYGDFLFFINLHNTGIGLYIKNIKTGELKKISDMGQVDISNSPDWVFNAAYSPGPYFIWDNNLFYERQTGEVKKWESSIPIYGGTEYRPVNIYRYNITTGTESAVLTNDAYMFRKPRVSGNLMIYSDFYPPSTSVNPASCPDQTIVYDLKSGSKRVITPPEADQIMDFKDTKILYLACDSWEKYQLAKYYLYDINSGETQQFIFPEPNEPQKFKPLSNYGAIFGTGFVPNGIIGSGVVFFQKDPWSNELIAYDLNKKSYIKLNLKQRAISVTGFDKKICFISLVDSNVYCHDYDTNYDYSLPILTNSKVIGGYNFYYPNSNYFVDDNGHGTHVAGIIAGNGSVKGVAPGANLISYKVLNWSGDGFSSSILSALDTVLEKKLDLDTTNDMNVINMSLGVFCGGYYDENCGPDDILSKTVDKLSSFGITSVIAAGNSGQYGQYTIGSPATARTAITVGAVDSTFGNIAPFSSKGPVTSGNDLIVKPDILAPGVNVCSAQLFGIYYPDEECRSGYIYLSGTSMASPHIAGIVALIKQLHPDWTPSQIKAVITSNADNLGYDANSQGSGFVNARKIFNLQVPAVPTGLNSSTFCQGVGNLASGVTFNWQAVTGATYYLQSYSGKADVNMGAAISRKVPSSTTCKSGPGGCSFLYGETFNWQVKACNSVGCSQPAKAKVVTKYCSVAFTNVCARCSVKQSDGKYLVGGMCGSDGKTLCQCSGTGNVNSKSSCSTSCKVNLGTYDTCAKTTNLCSRCSIKQSDNKYLVGGACSFDGKTLCQCSGMGTTKSSSTCSLSCQSIPGTYDVCFK